MKRYAMTAAIAGTLILAGCGGAKDSDAGGATAAGEAQAGVMPANWKASDACSIVDKAAAAEVLGQDVGETQLGLVHEPGTADAGTSECTYIGKDGATVARMMTRWSPINDNTPETIASARNTAAAALKAFSDKPIEDVPGLGKAAFLTPGIASLTVFIDDARMVAVTVEKVPDGASARDLAIALAKKAGA